MNQIKFPNTLLDIQHQSDPKNLDQTAAGIAYWLSRQVNLKGETVQFLPVTYRDTRISSNFARYFNQLLRDQLLHISQCRIVDFNRPDGLSDSLGANNVRFVVEGSYWDIGDKIKLNLVIKQVRNGQILGSAPASVDRQALDKLGLEIIPANFHQADRDLTAFQINELSPTGFKLDAWTNKGAENLIFSENDTMHLFVRVNMPCYLRLIYHLADGSRCLLLNNHFLDASHVNSTVSIPEDFICSAPFGAEHLQLFASTGAFDQLPTREEGGYVFIESSLNDILAKSRGFVKGSKKYLVAEKRLTITTVRL